MNFFVLKLDSIVIDWINVKIDSYVFGEAHGAPYMIVDLKRAIGGRAEMATGLATAKG